jgi:hypothetical protein
MALLRVTVVETSNLSRDTRDQHIPVNMRMRMSASSSRQRIYTYIWDVAFFKCKHIYMSDGSVLYTVTLNEESFHCPEVYFIFFWSFTF